MRRLFLYVLGVLFVGYVLYHKKAEIASILIVLTYMALFSLLLSPICAKMERGGVKSSRAAGYAVIGLFLIILIVFAALIPYLITQSINLLKRIAPLATDIMTRLMAMPSQIEFAASLFADMGNTVGRILSNITGTMLKLGMTAAAQIGRIGFSLVLTYYVLCDRKRIGAHLLLCLPSSQRAMVISALWACKNALMSYGSGLLKTSVFVAMATCVGLAVLGVENAFLLAILMGILEILPYLGPIIAAIPILLSAMLEGGRTAVLVFVMLVCIQQIEGNFVSPYFTASSTSIQPLAAVLSVFVMGSLLGISGILAAVPLLVVLQSVIWSMKQSRRIADGGIW